MQKARRVCIYTKPDHGNYQVSSPRHVSRSSMWIYVLQTTVGINIDWRMVIHLGFKLRKRLACVNRNYAFFLEEGIRNDLEIMQTMREMTLYFRGATQGIDKDLERTLCQTTIRINTSSKAQ